MKNKKILFVCQYFYPEKVSSGILPYELSCELAKEGYEVKALVGYPKEYIDDKNILKRERINNVEVERVKYLEFSRNNFVGRLLNYFTFCLSILLNFNKFRNIHFCISYTNPPLLPLVVAWFSSIYKFKYIFEIYDLYPDTAIKANVLKGNSLIAKVGNYCTNYALKKSWKVIVLASECKDYLINNKNICKDKINIIPNWYKAQNAILYNQNQKDQLMILYGGNMGIMQDMNTIRDLMIRVKDNQKFKFVFAGHGNKKYIIEEAIKENDLNNCIVYDFLPKDKYDELLNSADLAIVSLEKFGVGLGSPSKLYGYLSKGIPILAIIDESTDIVRDIKEYQHGIYCNNGDIDRLEKGLKYLYVNQEILRNMRTNSLRLFNEKYSLKSSTKKFVNLIKYAK